MIEATEAPDHAAERAKLRRADVADRGKCRSAITENVGVPVAWDGFWVMVVQGLAITS